MAETQLWTCLDGPENFFEDEDENEDEEDATGYVVRQIGAGRVIGGWLIMVE